MRRQYTYNKFSPIICNYITVIDFLQINIMIQQQIVFAVILKCIFLVLQASTGAEPQVAVLCETGNTYHPQYMSAAGRWTPDLTTKPHNCLKDKMEILDYCKKVRTSVIVIDICIIIP